MEQFKKWREKFDKNHRGDKRYEPTDKQGWRAALKWMKSKLECEIQPGDIGYFIDKELGDT